MALTAGELEIGISVNTRQIEQLRTQLNNLNSGLNNTRTQANATQGSFGKMVASFVTAQAVIGLATAGLKKLGAGIRDSVNNARDLEESQNKLAVTFSGVQKKAVGFRDSLVSSFGLSKKAATELLGSTGDLLTGFGFTQEKSLELSNSVQQLSVDLASFQNLEGGAERASQALTKALLGEAESAKELGIVIRETDVQARLAKEGKKQLKGEALLQAKAEVRLAIALEQSKNAIGDYARTQDQLANRQRTLQAVQEDIGSYLGGLFIPILNSVTGSVLKAAKSFRDFLTDAENLGKIQSTLAGVGAGFGLFIGVISELNTSVFTVLNENLSKTEKSITGMSRETKDSTLAFDILGSVTNAFTFSLNVGVRFVRLLSQQFVDFTNILVNGTKALIAMSIALVNPFAWKEAKKQIALVGKSVVNFTENSNENMKDFVAKTAEELKNIPKSAQDNSDKFQAIYAKGYDKNLAAFLKMQADIKAAQKQEIAAPTGVAEEAQDGEQQLKLTLDISGFRSSVSEAASLIGGVQDKITDSLESTTNAFIDLQKVQEEAIKKTAKTQADQFKDLEERAKAIGQVFASIFNAVGETIKGTLDVISEFVDEFYENQLAKLEGQHELEIEAIDAKLAREIELIENNGLTKDEALRSELESLQSKLETETDLEKKADLAGQISAIQKEIAIRNAENSALKDKSKAEKAFAKEKYRIEVEQFNIKKGLDIANAGISFAQGLVSMWASVWNIGNPIAAAVLGGIFTGVLSGIFASQAATIASKQPPPPPKFAAGTDFAPGGLALVGERGAELVDIPRGSKVLPSDQSNSLLNPTIILNPVIMIDTEEIPLKSVMLSNREIESLRGA